MRARTGRPAPHVEHDQRARRVHPGIVEGRRRWAADPGPPRRRERARRRPRVRPVDHALVEVAPEGKRVPVLVHVGRSSGSAHVRRAEVLVLEPSTCPDRPDHGLEHRAALLGHLDTLGEHGAARAQGRDDEIDRREGGHREVVAEEAGGAGERALGPGGPQRDGGHVARRRAPRSPSPRAPVAV